MTDEKKSISQRRTFPAQLGFILLIVFLLIVLLILAIDFMYTLGYFGLVIQALFGLVPWIYPVVWLTQTIKNKKIRKLPGAVFTALFASALLYFVSVPAAKDMFQHPITEVVAIRGISGGGSRGGFAQMWTYSIESNKRIDFPVSTLEKLTPLRDVINQTRGDAGIVDYLNYLQSGKRKVIRAKITYFPNTKTRISLELLSRLSG